MSRTPSVPHPAIAASCSRQRHRGLPCPLPPAHAHASSKSIFSPCLYTPAPPCISISPDLSIAYLPLRNSALAPGVKSHFLTLWGQSSPAPTFQTAQLAFISPDACCFLCLECSLLLCLPLSLRLAVFIFHVAVLMPPRRGHVPDPCTWPLPSLGTPALPQSKSINYFCICCA